MTTPDTTERTRAVAREVVERYLGRGDFSDLALLAPDIRIHTHAQPEPFVGRDGFVEFVGGIRRAFPDARFEIHQIVAEGDRAVVRWSMRGTHLAEIAGLPATKKRIDISALEYFAVDETGAIREAYLEMNPMTMLKQLVGIRRIPRPLGWLTRRQLKREAARA